jgi:murein DD-endopeptidase MepM/ murein hydrolase activator NlpD
MTNLPLGYLEAFPVQYHRHQIASGVIGSQHSRTRNGEHPGVGTSVGGGNFVVIIDSRQRYYHYYAHMEAPSTVCSGQSVAAGALHLHYQVSIRNDRGAAVLSESLP